MEMEASPGTSVDEMVGAIAEGTPLKRPQSISFYESDLPPEGTAHNKALFIKVEIMDKQIPCVMVDNGSALNLCPLQILPYLGLSERCWKRPTR